MARGYTVTFSGVAVSAPQDLVFVPGASNKLVRILRFWLSPEVDTSLATAQGFSLRCRVLPATVTPGTGGTTGITPSKSPSQGDAASSISTAGTNNTSKATTSGTAVVVWSGGAHLFQGIDKRFDRPQEIIPTAAFVFEMLSTPTGTVTLSGGVDLEEMG